MEASDNASGQDNGWFKQKEIEAVFGLPNEFCVGTSVLNAYKYTSHITYDQAIESVRQAIDSGAVAKDASTDVNAFSAIIANVADTDFLIVQKPSMSRKDFLKSDSDLALVAMDPQHRELAIKSKDSLVLVDPGAESKEYREAAGKSFRILALVPRKSWNEIANQ